MNNNYWKKSGEKKGICNSQKEKWITLDNVRNYILHNFKPLDAETKNIEDSSGYILAETLFSNFAVPPENVSQMDGFAVNSDSIKKADSSDPVNLKCHGSVFPGDMPEISISKGMCTKIMTGAVIPPGADTVVPVEYTDGGDQAVNIFKYFEKNSFITKKGSNIEKGSAIAQKGDFISWKLISLLAACGIKTLRVYRKPLIAFFTTGDELTQPGDIIKNSACIFNSTLWGAFSMLKESGFDLEIFTNISDNYDDIEKALKMARACDVVFFTGGVSRGLKDFVRSVIVDNGYETVINSVQQKPGKPFALFKKNAALGKGPQWVFGLPGNPVSSLLCLKRLAMPALDLMSGKPEKSIFLKIKNTCIMNLLVNRGKRFNVELLKTEYDPFECVYKAFSLPMKNSADISCLVYADAWLELGPGEKIDPNEKADIFIM
jgi:molybdenum cofactor synthesis domain-containing protein